MNASYEVFKDEENDRIQFRFHLEDDDPEVKNKMLIISRGYFTMPVQLFYDRHYKRGNKTVVENYLNDELTMYFETEAIKYFYVTKGYGADGGLFTIKKFEIENGHEVRERVIVYNSEGGVDRN
jgi:hypothetical protein